jgi:competence protein ComEC
LLIETAGHRLLYDTGPRYSNEADAGNRVILPYLKGRGIERLDALVVSHSDADHSGGALRVLEQIETPMVLSSLAADHAIVRHAPRHALCAAGQRWNWDGVQFEMLHPSPISYEHPGIKPNGRSCTLRIRAGRHAILLAGDIEAAQEAGLLADGVPLQSTVLLAPHHGSGTSSTTAFLAAVRPSIALFQVGYRNRYGHPKGEVLERYAARNIERLRTDQGGAIVLHFGTSLTVEPFRDTQRRYWFER